MIDRRKFLAFLGVGVVVGPRLALPAAPAEPISAIAIHSKWRQQEMLAELARDEWIEWAREAIRDKPIFADGDLLYQGVIIRESDDVVAGADFGITYTELDGVEEWVDDDAS